MSATPLQLPAGSVAIRMRVFASAQQELTDSMAQPWPRWVRRLYEMHALQSSRVDVVEGSVGVSAVVAALRVRLWHRLDTVGFVCAHLEELGWEFELSGPDLIAYKVTTPGTARESLEAEHLEGYLLAVSDIDERGHLRLYGNADLLGGGAEGDGDG